MVSYGVGALVTNLSTSLAANTALSAAAQYTAKYVTNFALNTLGDAGVQYVVTGKVDWGEALFAGGLDTLFLASADGISAIAKNWNSVKASAKNIVADERGEMYLPGFGIKSAGNSADALSGSGGARLISGTEGIVTGGDSTKLGKNVMESMGMNRGTKWTGYQAQHIIPAEMADHAVLLKVGIDLDDSTNGLFLRTPGNSVSALSRHRGYHSTYSEFVRIQLDAMDINQSVDVLQKQVFGLQQDLRKLQMSGLPLYPTQGATVDLWQRSLERIR